MSLADWVVLLGTLAFIIGYGVWRTRRQAALDQYLRGSRNDRWFTVGLSVMATQASAITFLSLPGQAFEQGLGFIQFYFGLPLALILVSAVAVPLFFNSGVVTAYEYLESRFDVRVRLFTAALFLVQRGLAAGITIYAPAIVLSAAFGWDLYTLVLAIGAAVVIYTVSGGADAVNLTQKWQMGVILAGMVFALGWLLLAISKHHTLGEAVHIAGMAGKWRMVNFEFDPAQRYTVWSGLTGGSFLALSYFGTDQSQVQRYLSASSANQSRMGLMFNAVLKIPMQFMILLTGVALFVFYENEPRPINHNEAMVSAVIAADSTGKAGALAAAYEQAEQQRLTSPAAKAEADSLSAAFAKRATVLRPDLNAANGDFVFIRFILHYLPTGAVGLLVAVILSAGMSSTSGELNALASTTVNDFLKRLMPYWMSRQNEVTVGKWAVALWGLISIGFALVARLFDNLIELVNLLGSLFYGTILGVFVCAVVFKKLGATPVLLAAAVAETAVLLIYSTAPDSLGYLWFNAIGCALVVALAWVISRISFSLTAEK